MKEELTIFQTTNDVTPLKLKNNTQNPLGAFMLSGDDIDNKVKVLSGGDRTRLVMIKLLFLLLITIIIFSCNTGKTPEPYRSSPIVRQLDWHALEAYTFVHFNMNTFTGWEWVMGK